MEFARDRVKSRRSSIHRRVGFIGPCIYLSPHTNDSPWALNSNRAYDTLKVRVFTPGSLLDLRLVVILVEEVELGVVAGGHLVGAQEAAKAGRALEEALALARAVVLAHRLVVLHAHEPAGGDGGDAPDELVRLRVRGWVRSQGLGVRGEG